MVFCPEEFVYLFVVEGAEVSAQMAWFEFLFLDAGKAFYLFCSFEQIASGEQHDDEDNQEEGGHAFNGVKRGEGGDPEALLVSGMLCHNNVIEGGSPANGWRPLQS
jgi:hypothetical protein